MSAPLRNSEIVTTSPRLLHALDRQRQFLIREYGRPMPCPSCGVDVTCYDAMGVPFDAYDFASGSDKGGHCPGCRRPLVREVFLIGGWDWAIDHEAERAATQEANDD